MASIVNLFLTYEFLRRLVTPFDKTKAFELGIIDESGKRIKRPKTQEEKNAYQPFDRLVYNLKGLLAKAPGGNTRTASYAAALWLVKEDRHLRIHPDMLDQHADELLAEIAPANMVGGGNVRGIAPGEDPPGDLPLFDRHGNKIRRRKKKRFKEHRNESK